MNELKKLPPVGSSTLTHLISETLPPRGSLSFDVLAGLLEARQFDILHHLWLLKLTGKHPDLLNRITGVDYTKMPDGLREALVHMFPELGRRTSVQEQSVNEADAFEIGFAMAAKNAGLGEAEYQRVRQTFPTTPIKEEPRTMKPYGHLCNRVREFVDYVRSNPPKTVTALAKSFGVSPRTIRRYLYGMYNAKVNMDVPRKVQWKGATSDQVPAYDMEELIKYPIQRLVEFPHPSGKASAEAKPETKPEKPAASKQQPPVAQSSLAVAEIEKLALKALREGNTAVASALGQVLVLVEKNTTGV